LDGRFLNPHIHTIFDIISAQGDINIKEIIRQEFFKLDTMPLKVLVLGHRFVRRLETDIINQVHPDLSPNLGLVIIKLPFQSGQSSQRIVICQLNFEC
jgi:hypothetical protein